LSSSRSSRGPTSAPFCAAAVSRIRLSPVPPDIPPKSTDTQCLFIGDQLARPLDVALAHQSALAESALPLRRFALEQMALKGAVALDLARSRLFESFGRCSSRLHRRHCVSSSSPLSRSQNHDHLPPFQAGLALLLAEVVDFLGHPVHYPPPQRLVSDFPSAAAD